MVTPLQSLRIQSSQFLLKALKENEQQTQSESSSTRSALLQRYGVDTSSSTSQSQKTLSALLDTLSPGTDTTAPAQLAAEISPDVTTASFMAGLKKTLEDMAGAPGTGKQAESMLAALDAGTLTVTDPLKGVAIKAWDVDSAADKDTRTITGDTVETSGWSDFLRTHLARGNSGAFTRTAEGSYTDAVTGDNAYFGTVGSTYVYLSWPQSTTAA